MRSGCLRKVRCYFFRVSMPGYLHMTMKTYPGVEGELDERTRIDLPQALSATASRREISNIFRQTSRQSARGCRFLCCFSPVKLSNVEDNNRTSSSKYSVISESTTSQFACVKPCTHSHLPVSKAHTPLLLQYWYSEVHE